MSNEVIVVLLALLNNKIPRPNGILNEVLKALVPKIIEGLV